MFFAPLTIACCGTCVFVFCVVRVTASWRAGSPVRRIVEGIPLLLLGTCSLATMLLSCADALAYRDKTPPGTTYLVNGHKMRIDCQGTGNPTLVLDAGLGNDGLIWSKVQSGLARTTQTCSFDRAGYGWSDPVSTRRDASHLSAELHDLLLAAGIRGPIVLAGHSIAGLYVRDYAAHYPQEVAGLIFVDASVPPTIDAPPTVDHKLTPTTRNAIGATLFAMSLNRLVGACPGSIPGDRLRLIAPTLEGICRENFATFHGELDNFDISSQEAAALQSTNLPILILSRETADDHWNQGQQRLSMLSTDSRRVIAAHSGHYIQVEQPAFLEEQIRLFFKQVRHTRPPP